MVTSRRHLLSGLAAAGFASAASANSQFRRSISRSTEQTPALCPDPIYEKPLPLSEAQFNRENVDGVCAAEISDFSPCGYTGPFAPSPPHADLNPRKAVIVRWRGLKHRFVFSHEASYAPWIELPGKIGLCNQFFESNLGAELFNQFGRRERNSSVDIIEPGPERVWIRWNYTCVHEGTDEHPALRGTEDYVAYPNGLIWRRLTYESLRPNDPDGYSWQPIDFFCLAPASATWADLFPRDSHHGDYLVGTVIDAYSSRRYDKFWDDLGRARRTGNASLLLEISRSRGLAMIAPFKAGCAFTVLGASSGFPSTKSQVVDHSFKDTGGWGWGAVRWDHWPVGWVNSEAHTAGAASNVPYSFGQFSHYIIDRPIIDAKVDFPLAVKNMALNRWSERHVYYTLSGAADNVELIRRLARRWLEKGTECANPESAKDLL